MATTSIFENRNCKSDDCERPHCLLCGTHTVYFGGICDSCCQAKVEVGAENLSPEDLQKWNQAVERG